MQKKIEAIFFDLEIIAFELIALNTVNLLTNSLKIWDTAKTQFFEPTFFQRSQKIWRKYCCADWSSVCDLFIFGLSISVLMPGFLGL